MGKIIVEFDADISAERLVRVLRRNNKQDREKYNITIIKREESPKNILSPTGEKVKLKKAELEQYLKSTSLQKQRAIQEQVFFKAQGTFRGSKPDQKSPYQTASPFYSNSVLGQSIFPGNQSIERLHAKLSRVLNDRHRITGQIGDWRETHSPKWKGFWSYRMEKFVRVAVKGQKPRNIIIYSDYQES